MKEETETVAVKLNIPKTNIIESGPITSWKTDGETVRDFIFEGSKITAGGDCSHEVKRGLLLGREAMTNLLSALSRPPGHFPRCRLAYRYTPGRNFLFLFFHLFLLVGG